ncbi:MAG: dTDP-4-dehydrorhamnose 3,5-epimerase family protein [Bacillota bacterium]
MKAKKGVVSEWPKGQIEGVVIKKLTKYPDRRGFLCETFRLDELPSDIKPAMSYVSYTEPGVARGPHEHREQTDIFAFIGPGNFLVKLWDRREGSATRGVCMEVFAGQDNPLTMIVPPGIVHGYRNISPTERGMVLNFPDKLYMGWSKREAVDEIRHEDDGESTFVLE